MPKPVKRKLPESVRLRMAQQWDERNGIKPRRTLDPEKQKAANVKRRAALVKHDWEAMESLYVGSEKILTLADIATQFGVSLGMVRKRAYKERWSHRRAEAQQKNFAKTRKRHLQKMAKDSISFDTQSADVARLGLAIIAKRLSEIWALMEVNDDVFKDILERMKDGEPVSKAELRSVLYAPELRDLAMSASTFQDMGRKAYGTDIHQIAFEGGSENVTGELTINIAAELGRDDPNRLAGFLEALERTGLDKALVEIASDDDYVDAEVVSDETEKMKEIEGPEDDDDDENE